MEGSISVTREESGDGVMEAALSISGYAIGQLNLGAFGKAMARRIENAECVGKVAAAQQSLTEIEREAFIEGLEFHCRRSSERAVSGWLAASSAIPSR